MRKIFFPFIKLINPQYLSKFLTGLVIFFKRENMIFKKCFTFLYVRCVKFISIWNISSLFSRNFMIFSSACKTPRSPTSCNKINNFMGSLKRRTFCSFLILIKILVKKYGILLFLEVEKKFWDFDLKKF